MTHDWRIEDREYRRHEQRRGRRFAYGPCEPESTCLVVIDMVDFFAGTSQAARGIIGNIDSAARALRAAGGLVAWVVPKSATPSAWQVDFYGEDIADQYAASGGAGEPQERLASGLVPEYDDVWVEKSTTSAFFPGGCDLHGVLRQRGITRVLISGTITSVCCESSARDASTLGYEVVLLADATADVDDAAHNASLRTIYRSFGDVRSCGDVLPHGAGQAASPSQTT